MEGSENFDRFTQFDSVENLCFLCLKEADQLCGKCGIPFCCMEHYEVHYDEKLNYCYPFRVLQRPEVNIYVISLTFRFLIL